MKFDKKPTGARSTSNPLSYEVDYTLQGVFDLASAKAIAKMLIPNAEMLVEGMVYLKDVQVREVGFELHDVTAVYGQGNNQAGGSIRFAFSIGAKTVHQKATDPAKVRKYPSTAPDFKGLINVTKTDGGLEAQGADLRVAESNRNITFKFPAGVITEAYATLLENLVGCTNSVRFLGRDPGEWVFLGADGSQGTDTETEITFKFGVEKNLKDLQYGDVTGVRKDGQELLWLYYGNAVDTGKATVKPTAAYVHAIAEPVNFAALLGINA